MSGLSLWLSPIGEEYKKLSELIKKLASETEGCLEFNPHLTLISDDQVPIKPIEEILNLVSEGVKEWYSSKDNFNPKQLEIEFTQFTTGDQFYQCVLASVNPTNELLNLNEVLRKKLIPNQIERLKLNPYFPHLSLVYGNLNQDQKLDILNKINQINDNDLIKKFKPIEILLVKTSGPSSDWEQLAKINLEDGSISS